MSDSRMQCEGVVPKLLRADRSRAEQGEDNHFTLSISRSRSISVSEIGLNDSDIALFCQIVFTKALLSDFTIERKHVYAFLFGLSVFYLLSHTHSFNHCSICVWGSMILLNSDISPSILFSSLPSLFKNSFSYRESNKLLMTVN